MKIEADSRESYFAAAGDRQEDLQAVDDLIRTHAPDLSPGLTTGLGGTMLGYGKQPYQTTAMKEPGTWPVLALAAQKRHLSLYVCAVIDGQYVAEQHAAELGKVSCGKSCIRFRRASDLDADALARVLADLNRRFVAGELLYGV